MEPNVPPRPVDSTQLQAKVQVTTEKRASSELISSEKSHYLYDFYLTSKEGHSDIYS